MTVERLLPDLSDFSAKGIGAQGKAPLSAHKISPVVIAPQTASSDQAVGRERWPTSRRFITAIVATLGAISSVVGILVWMGVNPFTAPPGGITGKDLYIENIMGRQAFSEVGLDAYLTEWFGKEGFDTESPLFVAQQQWEWGTNHRGDVLLQGINYIPVEDFSVALTVKYAGESLKLIVECFRGPAFTGQPTAKITNVVGIAVSSPNDFEELVGKTVNVGVGAFEFTPDDALKTLSFIHAAMPYMHVLLSTDRVESASIFMVRDERDAKIIADATTAMAVQARDRN